MVRKTSGGVARNLDQLWKDTSTQRWQMLLILKPVNASVELDKLQTGLVHNVSEIIFVELALIPNKVHGLGIQT